MTRSDAQFLLEKMQQFKAKKLALKSLIDAAVPNGDGTYKLDIVVSESTLELLKAFSYISTHR